MFNFNENDLLPLATAEDIHTYVNSYDMFAYYIGSFKIGVPIISPLDGEKNPSFSLFVKGGKLLFNDFRYGGGDIISFVKLKFKLSFQESINKIAYDAGLSDKFKTDLNYTAKPFIKYNKEIIHIKPTINVKRRKWNKNDFHFWSKFNISKETLKKYRVSPISHIFINNKIFKAETLAFVFKELKDGVSSLTIYQPYSSKMKWIKSHDSSVFYGWSQLPETGDTLIMTKSMKDVMTIDSTTKLPVVALQNEKIFPKQHIIDELKSRFTNIYLFYDNDWDKKINYGRKFGNKIANEFKLIQIEIPDFFAENFNAKDPSDLVKNAGYEYLNTMLLGDINNYKI